MGARVELVENGDIFTEGSDCIVIPVNCVGVMGAGVAKAARSRWPNMYQRYVAACAARQLQPGKNLMLMDDAVHVACLSTKDHWKNPSRIEWVRSGLADLGEQLMQLPVHQISMPALGAGLGGLPFAQVHDAVTDWARAMPADLLVLLHAPR